MGRTGDLARLVQLVEAGERLVTLVGPAGIGKTRLARELLFRLEPSADSLGEVRFCDVADARTPEDLVDAVVWSLGFSDQALRDAGAVEGSALALAGRGRLLLVLDNFEQLVETCVRVIDTWLDHAPELRLILTSRQRLHCRGEVVHQVAPLSTVDTREQRAEAIDLLLERAARASNEWKPTPEDRDELSKLVQELDGSPLAIELAAPRLVLLGPAELRRRLSDRFDVLRGHDTDDEHGIWKSIERSWRTLTEIEQRCLAQCAVFRKGFELEDAEAVLDLGEGSNETTLRVINALADKSLLSITFDATRSRARFDCLLSIRDYASKKLDELGLREATEIRHSNHFALRASQHAEKFMTDRLPDSRRWFRRQHANLMAAVDYARDPNVTFELLTTLGMSPGLSVASILVAAFERHLSREGGDANKRLHAIHTRARLFRLQGDCEQARQNDRAVLLACEDVRLRGLALTGLADTESLAGDLRTAEQLALQAGDFVRKAGSKVDQIDLLRTHGWIMMGLGRAKECREAWELGLDLADKHSLYLECLLEADLGGLCVEEARLEEARLRLSHALSIAEQLEDASATASLSMIWASLWHRCADFGKARACYQDGLERARRLGFRSGWPTGYLGVLEHETGNLDRARMLLRDAVNQFEQAHERRFLHLFEAFWGGVEAENENWPLARRLIEKAEAGVIASGDPGIRLAVQIQRGVLTTYLAAAAGNRDESLVAEVRELRARGVEGARKSIDVSIALRLLDRALGEHIPSLVLPTEGAGEFTVGVDAEWFVAPPFAKQDLSRKRVLKRLLWALVEAHREDPKRLVAHEQLVKAIWGTRPPEEAVARNRLYVAVATLRRLTNDRFILTQRTGYQLDPSLRVVIK